MAKQGVNYKNYFCKEGNTNLIPYLNEISKIPVLSKQEQEKLFIESKKGNKEAKMKLVKHNLKLVLYIVKRYYHDDFSFEDMIQEGNCALIDAVDSFDVKLNNKFSSYAAKAIAYRVIRYVQNNGRTIRVPNQLHKYIKIYDEIKSNNSNLSEDEIIKIMNITKNILENIKFAKITILSLETPINDDEDITIDSTISYDEVFTEDIAIKNIVFDQMLSIMDNCLTENEKIVIMHRYCFDNCDYLSQGQLGQMLGLTRQRIEQIEKKALRKLKDAFVIKQKQIYYDEEETKFKSKIIINNLF